LRYFLVLEKGMVVSGLPGIIWNRMRRGRNSQVLQVAAGEGDVGNNLNLAIANLGDDNLVTEVTDTALDLDAVVEELLEGGDIEDLVGGGLRSIDDVLYRKQSLATWTKLGIEEEFVVTYLLGNLLSLAATSLQGGNN
jgi:hypothetical protein